MRISFILLSIVILLAGCVDANRSVQIDNVIIPSGETLIKGDLFGAFSVYQAGGIEKADMQIVTLEDAGFDKAFQFSTPQKTDQPWNYSINAYNAFPVGKGEVVLASFYARAKENSSGLSIGTVNVIMMEPMPSYAMLSSLELKVDKDFRQGRIAFKADHDYQPAEIQLSLQFGYDPQIIEAANIEFINYGKDVRISDLAISDNAVVHKRSKKKVNYTYEGREEDAQWRKEAWQRIEKIRKADIAIIVQDKHGEPIENASVQIEMQKHKFWFGNENRSLLLLADEEYVKDRKVTEEDIEQYRQKFKDLFNITAFGNDLVYNYWYAYGKEKAKRVCDEFLKPNDIALRGIPLIWAGRQSWKNPDTVFELDDEELRAHLISHMTEMMTTLKGQAVMWDVLNEPISEPEFVDRLGRDEAVKWYKLAHKLEPDAKLYCNDYSILLDRGKLEKFIELTQYLIDNGAPIDGVSPQSHLWASAKLPSIQTLKENFDRLAELGLEIYPDQFEVIVPDEQLHSDYTRDFYILSFSHPSVTGVTHWGFWEGDIWMKDAAWFRKDWSEKTFAKVYKDLVFNKWWTNADGKTDNEGSFNTRGFLGKYEIIVTHDGQTKNVLLDLSKPGAKVKIMIF
jgi:endo-1,4-beta-xylanase